MPCQLPPNKLLPYCSQPLNDYGSESKNGLFRYANDTVKALLKDELRVYDKLKLPIYHGILSGSRTVAQIAGKKYPHAPEQLCAKLMPCILLELLTKGKPLFIYTIDPTSYTLSQPRQLTVELTENTPETERLAAMLKKSSASRSPAPFGLKRRTEELNLKISVSLMRSATEDLRFISRFNEETFFRGLPDKFFASTVVDLSDKTVKTGFAELYAMTFYGLSEGDLFKVDGVFGFSDTGVRSKDDKRQRAASELSAKLKNGNLQELGAMADKMGERLLELPLPSVNVNDPAALAQNCTLYAGFAQLGKAYLTALTPLEIALVPDLIGNSHEAAKQRAKLMSSYDYALQLCQGILTMENMKKPQLSALNGYKQAKQLTQ